MKKTKFKNAFLSDLMINADATRRIVYVALLTAINVISGSFLEFRMGGDTQFSITIAVSVITGVILGSGFGFVACFIGDLIGFFISSWGYMYMPWVGISTAMTAFISGIVIYALKFNFKGQLALKIVIICVSSLLLCTVAINSTGFYFYNYKMGFNTKVIDYVKNTFGGGVGYFGYLAYRMIFKGQIFNCLFNYALVGVLVPLVLNIKFIKPKTHNEEN